VAGAPDFAPRSEEGTVFTGISTRVRIPPPPLSATQVYGRLNRLEISRDYAS
jgi:hypothetical protein